MSSNKHHIESDNFDLERLSETEKQQVHDINSYIDSLSLPKYNTQDEFEKLKSSLKGKKTKGRTISYRPHIYLSIAASIAVLIIFGFKTLFFNENATELKNYSTALTEKQSINLPDNSEVNLNSESLISYNEKKWKTNRELTLEGEAFFKVKKGERFTVITELGEISVLGTSFNVRCRENIEVVCFTGKVKFSNDTIERILNAGDALKLSSDRLDEWTTNKPTVSWLSGVTEMDNVPAYEALNELSRQFNIKVNSGIITDTITVDFPNDDPMVAIEQILIPLDKEYTYNKTTRELTIHEE